MLSETVQFSSDHNYPCKLLDDSTPKTSGADPHHNSGATSSNSSNESEPFTPSGDYEFEDEIS